MKEILTQHHWEFLDVFKALFALGVGLVLGIERELKDKDAGLRTISIISLGSCLFTIISYKMDGLGDGTRIASYVVSGIGFLGAGVIFKERFSVYGLTTAALIWMSAAIGMAIGFGEFYLAITFLLVSTILMYSSNYFIRHVIPRNEAKIIELSLPLDMAENRYAIINDIKQYTKSLTLHRFEKGEGGIHLTLECKMNAHKVNDLESYLLHNKDILSFVL